MLNTTVHPDPDHRSARVQPTAANAPSASDAGVLGGLALTGDDAKDLLRFAVAARDAGLRNEMDERESLLIIVGDLVRRLAAVDDAQFAYGNE